MALKDNWIDKVDGVDINSAEDINQVARAVIELEKNGSQGGGSGENGVTFIPSVSTDGVISWTNNGELPNPTPVNIKGAKGDTPVRGKDYWTAGDRAEMVDELAEEIITQNDGDATDKVMSQAAVTAALKTVTALPYGGSVEWLEAHGDTEKLYQIDGYVWGHTESDGWVKSDTRFLVVMSTTQMTNAGGTPYILRSGNTGRVYAYHEASGDVDVPVYDTKPTTANEGDVIAVGGRKYRASVTSVQVPNWTTNHANPSSSDWLPNTRLNSTNVTTATGVTTTNFIDTNSDTDIVRIANFEFVANDNNCAYARYIEGKFDGHNSREMALSSDSYLGESNGVYSFKGYSGTVRFSGYVTNGDENVIITINEEITYRTETAVEWVDIGAYTPPVEAGWDPTSESFYIYDNLPENPSVTVAVYAADGHVYTFAGSSGWVQLGRYTAPTLSIDGELSDSSTNAVQNKVVTAALAEVNAKADGSAADISVINERLTGIETGSGAAVIPSFWQDAVDECITKIKALQADRSCVTFPFFSDNHTRDGNAQYMGIMIAHIMKECGIPYCFFGGDAITSAVASTADSDAEFKAQARAFDTAMSYIPDGRFCMALGNHETVLKYNPDISGSVTVTYDRNETYNIFLREEGTWQNKHFGGDGTYYYVDDIVSKVRWIVLNTNGIGNHDLDSDQLSWFRDKALMFSESGWGAVIVSHFPITRHHNASTGFTNNAAVIEMLQDYMGGNDTNKADIIGWYSGHIHRDRIYRGVAVNDDDDTVSGDMGFVQVTVTSDHTTIAYEDATKHTVANDDLSHAIDFVTVNKSRRTVNLTRLGIGEDRQYTY